MTDLADHEARRDALLGRIVDVLEADDRIAAAWLTGSLAAGTGDEWSDLDLHVAVENRHFDAVIADRRALYAHFGQPVLVQEITVNDENPGAHFNLLIFAGGIEVDCTLHPLRIAQRAAWSRLLFDRVGIAVDGVGPMDNDRRRDLAQNQLDFFWAMASVSLKEIGRGYTTGAAFSIGMMTDAFDTLWRLVHRPTDPTPAQLPRRHRPLIPELAGITPRLGARLDPPSVLAAARSLHREVERLHPALADLGVVVPVGMPAEIAAMCELVTGVLESETGPWPALDARAGHDPI